MLSLQLKENTKEAHQALEAVVIRHIKSIRDSGQYIRLLHKFYGFHFPMEQLFDKYFTDEIIPFYSARRRATQILQDLAVLGTNEPIALSRSLPVIDTLPKALGGFYVLEGSTQGGNIVAGMLIKYAGIAPGATSFFNVYGNESKKMWQSFKDKIDAYPFSPGFQEEMIIAAQATFIKFNEWMVS